MSANKTKAVGPETAGKSKVLVFDIETAGVQGLKADRGFLVCFGYKWLGDEKTHCLTIADYPGKHDHDDTNLLKRARAVMEEADGLVAHFGEKFDRPYLQARLLQAGLGPLPESKLTDTCLLARAKLRLSSSRLGNLAEFLKCKTGKMEKGTGWPLWWLGAIHGDKRAIEKMAVYCKQDVECLEQVYLKMRPMIPTRYLPVNEAIGEVLKSCPGCGGHRFQSRGWQYSELKRYKRWQCRDCGRWSRSYDAWARTPKI